MNGWLEPAGRVLHTVNMASQKEATHCRHTMPHANHNSAASGVSGIHRAVATETLSASNSASEGCVMLPSLLLCLPKKKKEKVLLWL